MKRREGSEGREAAPKAEVMWATSMAREMGPLLRNTVASLPRFQEAAIQSSTALQLSRLVGEIYVSHNCESVNSVCVCVQSVE